MPIEVVIQDLHAGKWIRGEQLGEGAHGTVYVAMHTVTGEFFAVKEINLSSCEPEFMKAIEKELGLLQRLVHPNIVKYIGMVRTKSSVLIFQVNFVS